MTIEQIRDIAESGRFPGRKKPVEVLETHISWVILTPDYAFKFKKPVRFDFLDFSAPALRLHACQEEVRLNQRMAPDMYLGVLPVGGTDGQLGLGQEPALDYAVHMKRLDNKLQMDHLLRAGEVQPAQMEVLARQLAAFHQRVRLQGGIRYDPADTWQDFADLFRVQSSVEHYLGTEAAALLEKWARDLLPMLQEHYPRLVERVRQGFWVDGHGDLHSRNIFLTDPPVAFDCIEFNPHFRKMDVLNELAFLLMDLDYHDHPELGATFLHTYRSRWEVLRTPEDRWLLNFFKAYRANVRLKVTLLEMKQHGGEQSGKAASAYWRLLQQEVAILLA